MKEKRDKIDVNLFIKEIKKRPALYDESMLEYKDFQMKLILWSEIAEIVSKSNDPKTVAKLKSKWKNLRDSYMKAHRLYTKNMSKGIPEKQPTYPTLSFILPHAKARRTKNDSESEGDGSLIGNTIDQEIENADSHNDFYTQPYSKSDATTHANAYAEDDADDVPIKKLSEDKLVDKCNDYETETFFTSIAETVKRLTPINQALVKKAVANIVLDVEVREARDMEIVNQI